MERICSSVLSGRLKDPCETCMLCPTIQPSNCCAFVAVSVLVLLVLLGLILNYKQAICQ